MSTTDLDSDPILDVDDEEPDEEPEVRASRVRREWTARRLATLLAPGLIYLAIREVGLLVLTWMASANGYPMADRLTAWDGQWFLGIAQGGYDGTPPELKDAYYQHRGDTAMAFFPGYPTGIRWLAGIDGPGGIGLVTAGLTITIVSGVICAYGLVRLGQLVEGGSRRVGLILVALFAAAPMSIVLSMVYSEALFCALAVWSLVGVLERRWVLAGICCGLAGLVRPTAAALILVIGLAVAITLIKRWDDGRAWLGGLLAPVGLVAYLGFVAAKLHNPSGWFGVQQRGWNSRFDAGLSTWQNAVDTLTRQQDVFAILNVGLIIAALVLAVICVVRRQEWPLLVYGLGVLAMDLASNGLFYSKVRLMLTAFTLLVPVAMGLAKRRTSTAVITICALTLASSWLGAYGLTNWGYAI
ncbi:MAG TPA: hypothetical protein VGR06_29960 [Actinophytocola sp.]|uniref:hypothetical protein n=1 Tax=Actinophytocola sp. TaxID=1872138 RepID=UPI002E061F30|nr:hypothetical protein [Actinophytocola sp.]